jgi:glycosyltransferase involved in cell wall biosynthesis
MISIVIPLFNKQAHIKDTLISVFNQTFKDFEVLVVNDGSTDSSLNEVLKFKDDRLFVFTKENGGESSARNFGISRSRYNYVTFLDADDILLSDHLMVFAHYIENFNSVAFFGTNYFVKRNNVIKLAHVFDCEFIEVKDYFYYSNINVLPIATSNTVLMRKDIFDHVGFFDCDLRIGPDLDFWFRVSVKYEMIFINKATVVYNQDAENRAMNSVLEFNDLFFMKMRSTFLSIDKLREGVSKKSIERYILNRLLQEFKIQSILGSGNVIRKKLIAYREFLTSRDFFLIFVMSFLPMKYLYKIWTYFKK